MQIIIILHIRIQKNFDNSHNECGSDDRCSEIVHHLLTTTRT